jgi:anti-sigma regulatory factor (Ser/Thr protein kinase)
VSAAPSDTVGIRLTSDPRYLPLVRAVVDQAAVLVGIGGDDRFRVLLAVTEAVSNVIRHVYKDRHDQPIELGVRAAPGTLTIEVVDHGRFVDPARIASRPLDDLRPGGLGVHLIRSTMDVVEYKQNPHGGTTLTLVKHASSEASSGQKDPA